MHIEGEGSRIGEIYSKDYRQRVMTIKQEQQLSWEETSKRFTVAIRTLFYSKKRMDPKTKRDKPATKVDMQKLSKHLETNPDRFYSMRELKITG